MAEKFKNYTAAGRRASMRAFGLAPAGADLSFIAAPEDMRYVDLSAQVDGLTNTFTLPNAAQFVDALLWNNQPTYNDTLSPGFTLSPNGVTITTNFVPNSLDTLHARFWPL